MEEENKNIRYTNNNVVKNIIQKKANVDKKR